ncbi:MAG: hypothetical protein U0941_13740 [Planctomycetaceae bacterium]
MIVALCPKLRKLRTVLVISRGKHFWQAPLVNDGYANRVTLPTMGATLKAKGLNVVY